MYSTLASKSIAVLYAIVTGLEEIVEDEGLDPGRVSLGWGLLDEIREDPGKVIESGIVNVGYPGLVQSIVRRVDSGVGELTVVMEDNEYNMNFYDLYDEIVKILLKDSFEFAMKASYTTKTGIEFIFFYLEDGSVAMLEGEHFRVRLPRLRAVASIHTHPEGACGLSRADVESGLDLLSEGGLALGAATPSCMFIMYRRYLISEDDYVILKKLIYKNKNIFKEKLKSIRFAMVRY